ncbi:MAG: hypothetical protein R2874_08975 [Desulfobacterales bacterium]
MTLLPGGFPGLVNFEDDFVRIPVGKEIHPSGKNQRDHHAGGASQHFSHPHDHPGHDRQKKGCFNLIAHFITPCFILI